MRFSFRRLGAKQMRPCVSIVRPFFDDTIDVESRARPRLVTLAPATRSIPREAWLLARWSARHAATADPHIALEAPLLPYSAPRNEERYNRIRVCSYLKSHIRVSPPPSSNHQSIGAPSGRISGGSCLRRRAAKA